MPTGKIAAAGFAGILALGAAALVASARPLRHNGWCAAGS